MATYRSPSPEEEAGDAPTDKQLISNTIQRVVNALGALDHKGTYRPGDSCYGCLKDLKQLWKLDDHDDARTVARLLWETNVFTNDLVHLLQVTTDRAALACTDLMCAMTWPIDLIEELKELEELDDIPRTDYTVLINSHIAYKRSMVNNPNIFKALVKVIFNPLAKTGENKAEPKDKQTISLVLHLIRNLAFIKTDQSELLAALSQSGLLDVILTLASHKLHNTIILDILHLIFRTFPPSTMLASLQKSSSAFSSSSSSNSRASSASRIPAAQSALSQALALDQAEQRQKARTANSRHSRFGTTIAVRQHNASFIIHKQSAIKQDPGVLLDESKKMVKRRTAKHEENYEQLSFEASKIMSEFCVTFMQSCFSPFLACLIKDIRSERAHITEKDNLRLLFIMRWFLEYFLLNLEGKKWAYDLVSEIMDRVWVGWVLKRMREALEEKPKLYMELRLGTECLTQLLLLFERIPKDANAKDDFKDAAETLQNQLYYNGQILDLAFDNVKEWKEGGKMGFDSLEASIHLAFVLLRMLEAWGKDKGGLYIRKRAKKKAAKKKQSEEDGIMDVEDDPGDKEDQDRIQEQKFTFEKYEQKFADEDIARSLLAYLSRWKEFKGHEQMKRVIGLIHRQAIKAQAEGLFFKVSTLNLFKNIAAEQRSFPKNQCYDDLGNVIKFIVHKFMKAVKQDPLLIVEAFAPKNRGKWKALSSWEEPTKETRQKKKAAELDPNAELKVKRGYSRDEQIGIAVGCLIEAGKRSMVDWIKEILLMVIRQRHKIIEETDSIQSDTEDEEGDKAKRLNAHKPSMEAMAKFENWEIPCVNDEQENAVTKDQHVKLLLRLIYGQINDDTAVPLDWYIPASVLPSDLSACLAVINQYLEDPIDLAGKNPLKMLTEAKSRRRRRAAKGTDDDDESAASGSEDEERVAKKQRKKKEAEKYKSAEFVEDSDEDFDADAFFAKERAQREKNETRATQGLIVGMKATGTKKRRKPAGEKDDTDQPKKARRSDEGPMKAVESSESEVEVENRPKPRPRPRPKAVARPPLEPREDALTTPTPVEHSDSDEENRPPVRRPTQARPRIAARGRSQSKATDTDDAGLNGLASPFDETGPSLPRVAAKQRIMDVDSDEEPGVVVASQRPKTVRRVIDDDDDDDF